MGGAGMTPGAAFFVPSVHPAQPEGEADRHPTQRAALAPTPRFRLICTKNVQISAAPCEAWEGGVRGKDLTFLIWPFYPYLTV